jgi:hypothetical protein
LPSPSEVKQLLKEILALLPRTTVVLAVIVIIGSIPSDCLARALKDLLKLSPIEPDAAAARAVVDLHALAVGRDQIRVAVRANHFAFLLEAVAG